MPPLSYLHRPSLIYVNPQNAGCNYINPAETPALMPLQKILAKLDKPADLDTKTRIIAHMKKRPMEKEELMQLVAQRIKELPDIPRKILAMYYFENMRLAEIAAVFGLTESRICQIHSQTIIGLRAFLGRAQSK